MNSMLKGIGFAFLISVFSAGLPLSTLSATDRTVYDKPGVQTGKVIKGKVMNVDEKSLHTWNVAVKNQESGEVVILHIDKNTTRKDKMLKPDLGDYVIAQYNEQNNHAYSFLTDEREHN